MVHTRKGSVIVLHWTFREKYPGLAVKLASQRAASRVPQVIHLQLAGRQAWSKRSKPSRACDRLRVSLHQTNHSFSTLIFTLVDMPENSIRLILIQSQRTNAFRQPPIINSLWKDSKEPFSHLAGPLLFVCNLER